MSLDPKWLAGLAGRAVGKRADATTDTVAAWKRTKSQASRKTTVHKPKAEVRVDRNVRYEAAADDAKLAIDVGADTPKDTRPKSETTPRPAAKPDGVCRRVPPLR